MSDAEKLRLAVEEDVFVGDVLGLGSLLAGEIRRLRAELDRDNAISPVRANGDDFVYSLGRFRYFYIARDTDWARLRAIVDDAERRAMGAVPDHIDSPDGFGDVEEIRRRLRIAEAVREFSRLDDLQAETDP